MLHTYLLTGGDRLINLIACGAFAAAIVGVSGVVAAMGLGTTAQTVAALACATLPNAILQASGAKNDMLLALWTVCAIYFALRGEAMWLGLAVGLALATKGTAYLFLPPLLFAAGVRQRRLPVDHVLPVERSLQRHRDGHDRVEQDERRIPAVLLQLLRRQLC